MKRILFLIRTLNIGGAEHVLVSIANRMAEDGFSVAVQTLFDEGHYRELLSPKVTYRGGFSSRIPFLRKVVLKLYYILPSKLLGRLLIRGDYSHVVGFVEDLPTKIVSGCPGRDRKKIAWVHTDLYTNYGVINLYGSVENNRKCYQAFDRVICVSNDVKNGFLKRIGSHPALEVQYNPIDKKEILRRSLCAPAYEVQNTDAFRLVAVGRLAEVKGYDMLIEAMAQVKEKADRLVELYIIGGGPEYGALQERIQSKNLQDTVFLCGQQTNPQSIMLQCDMQVMSSKAEGYSLALCEGHMLGLPVVATKCAGSIEIVSDSGAGILVEVSSESLAEGILSMLNDTDRFEACRTNAVRWSENYDVDAVYRQIEERFS